MRINKHLPQFTKAHRTFASKKRRFHDEKPSEPRRAHGLLTDVRITASVQEKAHSRRHLYMHSMARQMDALRSAIARRAS